MWASSGLYLSRHHQAYILLALPLQHCNHSQTRKLFRNPDSYLLALACCLDIGSRKDRMQEARFSRAIPVDLWQSVRLDSSLHVGGTTVLPWPFVAVWRDKDPAASERIEPPVRDIIQDLFRHHTEGQFIVDWLC